MEEVTAKERRAKILADARRVLDFDGGDEEKRAAFPKFYEDNTKLFSILCSGRCDLRHLEMMLELMDTVDLGTKTVSTASAEVAGVLNAAYVDSVVPKPTPEQACRKGEKTRVTVAERR